MEQWRRWHTSSLNQKSYYLAAGEQLAAAPPATVGRRNLASRVDLFTNTGLLILRSVTEAYAGWRLPEFPFLENAHAVMHLSAPLANPLRTRGQANLSIHVTSPSSRFHVVAYLYDRAPNGTASLITHGAMTAWEARAETERVVGIKMRSAAYDVPKGHKLVLLIDTFDPLYLWPVKEPFHLDIHYRPDLPSVLNITHLASGELSRGK